MIKRDWTALLPKRGKLASLLVLQEDELDEGDEVWIADLGRGVRIELSNRKPTRGWWDAEVYFDDDFVVGRSAREPDDAVWKVEMELKRREAFMKVATKGING